MNIEFGNVAVLEAPPGGLRTVRASDLVRAKRPYPCVTYVHVPDGSVSDDPFDTTEKRPLYSFNESQIPHPDDVKLHLAQVMAEVGERRGVTTKFAQHEAVMAVVHPTEGVWQRHSAEPPIWVACDDNPAMERFLAAYYGCPAGRPSLLEETHYTRSGPPGIDPVLDAVRKIEGNITQNGRDMWARNNGGGQVGMSGTATATTSTSLTSGTVTSVSSNQFAGCRLITPTAWAKVVSHTSGTTPVFTLDRWYSINNPGGSAASTPSGTTTYNITDGGTPAWFVGISADTTSPGSPDTRTSLTSEITTSGGGLVRKQATYAHTASANTYTLTVVFTANGSDSLPVTVDTDGVFDSMVPGDTTSTCMFLEQLSSSATLSSSGDSLTLTITVTGT